jgi:hypothetical protein
MDETGQAEHVAELRAKAVSLGVLVEYLPGWDDLVPASVERARQRRREERAANLGVLWQFLPAEESI